MKKGVQDHQQGWNKVLSLLVPPAPVLFTCPLGSPAAHLGPACVLCLVPIRLVLQRNIDHPSSHPTCSLLFYSHLEQKQDVTSFRIPRTGS